MRFRCAEGILEVDPIRIFRNTGHVDQFRIDVMDDGIEGMSISPAWSKVLYFNAVCSRETKEGLAWNYVLYYELCYVLHYFLCLQNTHEQQDDECSAGKHEEHIISLAYKWR